MPTDTEIHFQECDKPAIDQSAVFRIHPSTSLTTTLGLLVAWYSCAILSSWHLTRVLSPADEVRYLESVEVSFLLMVAGSLLTLINFGHDSTFYAKAVAAFRMRSTHQAAICHYLGTLSMCMAQAAVSASLAQVVKSTEPIMTLAFSWIFSRTYFGTRKLFGIVLISGGVAIICRSGDDTLDISGVLCALISACCFPLRNISSHKCEDSLTSTQRFGLASACACIPALLLCLAKFFALGHLAARSLPADHLAPALLSHVGYNAASYAFLAASCPVLHSVANILKRLVVIASMFAMDGRAPSAMAVGGLGMVAVGLVLCSDAGATVPRRSHARTHARTYARQHTQQTKRTYLK